jgi:hypothetical protein
VVSVRLCWRHRIRPLHCVNSSALLAPVSAVCANMLPDASDCCAQEGKNPERQAAIDSIVERNPEAFK